MKKKELKKKDRPTWKNIKLTGRYETLMDLPPIFFCVFFEPEGGIFEKNTS